MFQSFSDKVDRFRKFTILQPNFRNKYFQNWYFRSQNSDFSKPI